MAKEHRSPLGPVSQGPSFKNTHLLGKVAAVSSMLSPCNFFRELFFSHVESCRGWAEITVKMSTLRNLKIAWKLSAMTHIHQFKGWKCEKSEGVGDTFWVHCISGHANDQFNPRPPGAPFTESSWGLADVLWFCTIYAVKQPPGGCVQSNLQHHSRWSGNVKNVI